MVFGSTVTSGLCYYCLEMVVNNKRERREESLYITVVEVEGSKSVRERYIRVAAIDNMITEGS
jgi:hypothetical protein